MRTRLFALALLVAFAPVAVPVTGWAQSASDEASKNLARARFKEGVAYFDGGQYELARGAFLQAYTLRKHPAILGNLAWSCVRGGHFLEGHRYFEQFLAESKDLTAAQRADVADGLSQADARLGRIEIPAAAGSDVSVDGDHVGKAPLSEPIVVDVGAHAIKVIAPDGTAGTQSVTVLAGEKQVARLALTSSHPPAAHTEPAPQPTPPSAPVAAPAPTATPEQSPAAASEPESSPSPHRSSFWPTNMVPVYVGAGLVVAGAGVAIGAAIAKQSAQTNANNQAQLLMSHNDSCPAPSTATSGQLSACATYANDNTLWNQDSTAANVAIAVGAAALVGTVVYWIVAKKRDDAGTDPAAATETRLVPTVGTSFGGLSASTTF